MKIQPIRLVLATKFRGEKNYLRTQRYYELVRTIIYFLLAGGIFALGYYTTQTKANLLTIVAVLGALPACKSLVSTIVHFLFKGCERGLADRIEPVASGIVSAFDRVFTSNDKSYQTAHVAVRNGNIIVLGTGKKKYEEEAFVKHVEKYLKLEGHTGSCIKVFWEEEKYLTRLAQLGEMEDDDNSNKLMKILLDISL